MSSLSNKNEAKRHGSQQQLKFLTAHPTDQDHAIILEDLTILLDIFNIASFFHGCTPAKREYNE
jgi:hypothetical protein